MLTLLAIFILNSTPVSAQDGTVPITVLRLPEYPQEKAKSTDPVADPVKSFDLGSNGSNGWYKGEGGVSSPKRKPAAAVDPEVESAIADPEGTGKNEAQAIISAVPGVNDPYGNGSAANNTQNPAAQPYCGGGMQCGALNPHGIVQRPFNVMGK
jgi:hypothetical protein